MSIEIFRQNVDNLVKRALFYTLPEDHAYAKVSEDIQFELRTLVIRLSFYQESDREDLEFWCQHYKTLRRLANIEAVINAISEGYPLEQNQGRIEKKIKKFLKGDNYDSEFIAYLELNVFFEAQKKYTAVLEKLHHAYTATRHGATVLGGFWRFIQRVLTTLVHVGASVSVFAMAIPIVQSVVMVIPLGSSAVRSWLERKGVSDKVVTTAVALFGILALALSFAYPIAAMGLGAGMVAAGIYVDEIRPYFKMRAKLSKTQQEIPLIDDRILELQGSDNRSDIDLNEREKNDLLKTLARFVIFHLNIKPAEMDEVRQLIQRGRATELAQHPLIAAACELGPQKSMREYLINSNINHHAHLQNDISKQQAQLRAKRALVFNGLLTLVGSILLAVPFPPVQIAGAGVLLISSLIGLSLHYDLYGKLKNAFNHRGYKKLPQTDQAVEPMDNIPQPDNTLEMTDLSGGRLMNSSRMYQELTRSEPSTPANSQPLLNTPVPSKTQHHHWDLETPPILKIRADQEPVTTEYNDQRWSLI